MSGLSFDLLQNPPRESARTRQRGRNSGTAAVACEPLEGRTLLSAVISWMNRATTTAGGPNDTDGFGRAFGTLAPVAREVIDAAILSWSRVIGDFNYSNPSEFFRLTLSVDPPGSGFGGLAQSTGSVEGKPNAATVSIGGGNIDTDPNNDNGWFIDPTPFEHSEFMGGIVNAYAGDAHAGSPAAGRGDFFTVAALELAHAVGVGLTFSGFAGLTTNTGLADPNGLNAKFWVFRGPSIKHLMTSNNGGFDAGRAVHSAEAGGNITFDGLNYIGAQDVGNAFYENGRRYLVSNTSALMLKDAYGFSVQDPARWGTFYCSLHHPPVGAGQIVIRGGDTTGGPASNDFITIDFNNNVLTVSVDIGNDIPGTGALPGAGNLPSFVATFSTVSYTSVSIDTGAGNDVVIVNGSPANRLIAIDGGAGDEIVHLALAGHTLDAIQGVVGFDGNDGSDMMIFSDQNNAFNDPITISGTSSGSVTRPSFGGGEFSRVETVDVRAGDGASTINVPTTPAGTTLSLHAGGGNDTVNLGSGNLDANLGGPVNVTGGDGTDTLTFDNALDATLETQTLAAPNFTDGDTHTYSEFSQVRVNAGPGGGTIDMNRIAGFTIFNGGAGNDTINVGGGNLDVNLTRQVNIAGNGGNDTVVIDDRFDTGADTYRFFGTNVFQKQLETGGFLPPIIVVVESVVLRANSGNNTVFIEDYTIPVTVEGNEGNDALRMITPGSFATFDGGLGLDDVYVDTDGVGSATVQLAGSQDLESLFINSGGRVTMQPGGNHLLRTRALSMGGTGRFDLAGNSLILDYSGASPAAAIRAALIDGRNGGAWNGTSGIVSSTIAAGSGRSIGYAESSALFSSFPAVFEGQQVDSTAILLRESYNGDANLDGRVNLQDFNRLASRFGQNNRAWSDGDFDYTGNVNLVDFNLLASNFGRSDGPSIGGTSDDGELPRDPLPALA